MLHRDSYQVALLATHMMQAANLRPGMTFEDTTDDPKEYLGEAMELMELASERLDKRDGRSVDQRPASAK